MNSNHIIWPVLAQVFLTLIIFIILGVRKTKAVKAGEVNRQEAALNNRVWPMDVVKVSNNIANQFEVPVLFYVLCLVLYGINAVSMVSIVLAWLFALSRFAHAYVHYRFQLCSYEISPVLSWVFGIDRDAHASSLGASFNSLKAQPHNSRDKRLNIKGG